MVGCTNVMGLNHSLTKFDGGSPGDCGGTYFSG